MHLSEENALRIHRPYPKAHHAPASGLFSLCHVQAQPPLRDTLPRARHPRRMDDFADLNRRLENLPREGTVIEGDHYVHRALLGFSDRCPR